MNRHLVIDAEHLAEPPRSWLAERTDVVTVSVDDEQAWWEALGRADALVVRTYTRVDAALLDRAPRLRVVGRAGVGLDNVDVAACRERGVEVVYTPDANAGAVAELLFGLLLDVLRPKAPMTRALTSDEWRVARTEDLGERELSSLTLGLWGMGRVGRRMAAVARGFSMDVLYHDLREIPESERCGASSVARAELLRRSDVVSVHVDGREANRELVDREVLACLRPDAIFVNSSRGFVVSPASLRQWLDDHPEARAICDVHEPEPVPTDHPLLGHPRALLTPHVGAGTRPAKHRMGRVVEDVWRVLQGEAPAFPAP